MGEGITTSTLCPSIRSEPQRCQEAITTAASQACAGEAARAAYFSQLLGNAFLLSMTQQCIGDMSKVGAPC